MKPKITTETHAGISCLHGVPRESKHDRPIIFIHGLWAGNAPLAYSNWAGFCLNFGWEVFVPDVPGHGRSPSINQRNMGRDGLSYYADCLEQFLSSLGASQEVYLVGHSAGGLLTQMISNHPRVKGLVLLQSAPPRGIRISGLALKKLWKFYYLKAIILGRAFSIDRKDLAELMLNRLPEEHVESYPIFPESGTVVREIVLGKVSLPDDMFTRQAVSSMVMAGTHDQMLPPIIQKKIAAKFGSVYKEIPHGHLPMIEDGWSQPITQILGFFNTLV